MQEATARGLGRLVSFAAYASAVLNNGLGQTRCRARRRRQAFERDQLGYGPLVIPELAEAAARTGDVALVTAALEWLSERTRVMPTEWALGIEARIRALLSDGEPPRACYRESIERLGRTRVRAELARAHLLYGEWLRRERRRADAREQLRTAYEMLDAMGIGAFAERARRELLATGETARKRTVETTVAELTAQEAQVARLAREGLSNPRDRRPAVHQRPHGPVPPGQGLHQARHQLPQPARPGPARRPGHRPAALANRPCLSSVTAAGPGHWPLALCTGGYERGPGRMRMPEAASTGRLPRGGVTP